MDRLDATFAFLPAFFKLGFAFGVKVFSSRQLRFERAVTRNASWQVEKLTLSFDIWSKL